MESMLMDATSESETLPLPNTANISPTGYRNSRVPLPKGGIPTLKRKQRVDSHDRVDSDDNVSLSHS